MREFLRLLSAAGLILICGCLAPVGKVVNPDCHVDLVYGATGDGHSTESMGAVFVARPDVSLIETDEQGRAIIGKLYPAPSSVSRNTVYARAFSTVPVDQWIALALQKELEQVGFEVHLTETLPGKVTRGIELTLTEFSSRTFVRLGSGGQRIGLQARVVRTGYDESRLSSVGRHVFSGGRATHSGPGYAEGLEKALQNCLKQLMPQLLRQLSH